MKVAYLAQGYPRTSHSFIRREISALESLGAEVLRFSQRPLDEPLVTEADQQEHLKTRVILSAGVAAHGWAMLTAALGRPLVFARALATALRLGWRSERGLLLHLVYLAEAAVLERWLRGTGTSHLHAHFGANSTTIAMLCRQLGGPPFSFTIHGLDEYDQTREKVSRAAFVVAISSFGKAQLYRRLDPSSWPKVHEVRCGLGGDLLDEPLTPVPAVPRLVCVSRLHVEKGHLLLLEAAARLVAEGVELELVLVGDGPLRPLIEEEVGRLGLEGRVRLPGWTGADGVREAIVGSRALVLPSFAEGLPVVLMEAFALGRPVIATSLSGIPELVRPGVNGWLVPAGSVEALVSAMREVLQAEPAHLGAMGRAGAAAASERHDARREARTLFALFQRSSGACAGRAPADRDSASEGPAPVPRAAAR